MHAGLRAIAERLQHLGKYKSTGLYVNSENDMPINELLRGNWWKAYRKELLSLLYFQKTEENAHGQRRLFLESEIIKLTHRLADFNFSLFLRMAVPMGIMDALAPKFRKIVFDNGYMMYGPKFSFNKPYMVDTAITIFCLQYPSWEASKNEERWRIKKPEHLGSHFLNQLIMYMDGEDIKHKLPHTLSFLWQKKKEVEV
ncbi:hypothetical protein ACFL1A_00720 [Patescibacteria group bacterium]